MLIKKKVIFADGISNRMTLTKYAFDTDMQKCPMYVRYTIDKYSSIELIIRCMY